MRAQLIYVLANVVPFTCRRCQAGIYSFQLIRPFASSTKLHAQKKLSSRDIGHRIERQILGTESSSSPKDSSPMSFLTKMMAGEDVRMSPSVTRDYSRMAESLEAEMIRHPYADRGAPHHLHVYSHKHNMIITLTRPNGNPLLSLSCGHLGFRKSQRSGFDPAFQLSSHILGQIQEKGLLLDIQRIELVFRGFGPGRDAFVKVLLGNEGRNIRGLITSVTDSTRIKFGGARSRKVRRLG
jgi:small subunit ribosomal protein S11